MLRVSHGSVVLVRRFGSSFQNLKPFDLTELSKGSPRGTEPFKIDSLFHNRQGEGKSNGPVKDHSTASTSPANNNRFAAMFNCEKTGKAFKTNHNQKKHKSSPKQYGKPHRKIVRFEFNSGSQQSQAALKAIIAKVHSYDSNYKVRYLEPESKKVVVKHLVDISNGLDLKQHGLVLIAPTSESEYPLIKQTTAMEMLKNYGEELAVIKEKELLEKGSITALKVLKQRQKVEKRKSAIKSLQMFWHISVGDLKNQKRSEIECRLAKGENFNIYVKSKGGPSIEELDDEFKGDDITKSWKYKDEDALSLELKKREMIHTVLQEILLELPCQYEIKGSLETRLLIPITPKVEKVKAAEPKAVECKKKKVQKQKQKQEKKPQVNEDDLDALYLFKIED